MLIIGHRGAAGLKPENTLASLRAGMEAGADIIEFDVRLTKDKIPVLAHDFSIKRTHYSARSVSEFTFAELQKRLSGGNAVISLDAALKLCFGKVFLNIEFKQTNGFTYSLPMLKKYIAKKSDWRLCFFSAFSPAELARIREAAPHAQLALLQYANPFLFMRWMRRLRLSAVGFHRLHANRLALEVASRLGIFTYAYTVNRPTGALRLAEKGIDAIITGRPDLMAKTTGL